jgi:hypothetical protein
MEGHISFLLPQIDFLTTFPAWTKTRINHKSITEEQQITFGHYENIRVHQ